MNAPDRLSERRHPARVLLLPAGVAVALLILLVQMQASSGAGAHVPDHASPLEHHTEVAANRGITTAAGETAERSKVARQLVVVVRHEGLPLPGARVWIVDPADVADREVALPLLAAAGSTDAEGRLVLDSPQAPSIAYAVSRDMGAGSASIADGQSEAYVDIPAGSFRFVATTTMGSPASGVEIELSTSQIPYRGIRQAVQDPTTVVAAGVRAGIHRGTTGPDGSVVIRGLPAGRYIVSLARNVLAHSDLPGYVDIGNKLVSLEASVAYPVAALTQVAGDDLLAIQREPAPGFVGAGAAAGEMARMTRWLRKRWGCHVHVEAADLPRTIRVPATAICRRTGDLRFEEIFHPVDHDAAPQLIDVSCQPSVRQWPLVAVRLVSDGVDLVGGAWTARGHGLPGGVSGNFGAPSVMPPGSYQFFTLLAEPQRALSGRRFLITEQTREILVEVGAARRMCRFEFRMRDGSNPRYASWALRDDTGWEDRGFTEGTDSLFVIAPTGRLRLAVKCFGCADFEGDVLVDARSGLSEFVVELDC